MSSSFGASRRQHASASAPAAGVQNVGNTCYLSSVVQALFATDAFRSRMLALQFGAEHRVEKDAKTKQFATLVQLQRLMGECCAVLWCCGVIFFSKFCVCIQNFFVCVCVCVLSCSLPIHSAFAVHLPPGRVPSLFLPIAADALPNARAGGRNRIRQVFGRLCGHCHAGAAQVTISLALS